MNAKLKMSIGEIISCLPEIFPAHSHNSKTYKVLEDISKSLVSASVFIDPSAPVGSLGDFGEIKFPYTKMGAIDSLNLFGLDELIIFSFYWTNRHRYNRAADIGANIGLHSILMGRCGWQIKSYEPDPIHAALLRRNLELNNVTNAELIEAAVSDTPGTLEFVRVLGNTTGSHLAGAKSNPYGELERFPVKVLAIEDVMSKVDFVKMDVEGQEKIIICSTNVDHWRETDMMVEVGSPENAQIIFEHLKALGVNSFSQKLGWQRVDSLEGMPMSYKEGSLFVSMKPSMPWAT